MFEYNYIQILKDLVTFKMSLSRLKKAMKVKKVLDNILKKRFKSIKLKDLKILTAGNIEDAIDVYNMYTLNRKIDKEEVFEKIEKIKKSLNLVLSKIGPEMDLFRVALTKTLNEILRDKKMK